MVRLSDRSLRAGDVQTCLFPVPELVRVVRDLFKPELLAERSEEIIIGMRQRVGEAHLRPAINADVLIRRHDTLVQSGERRDVLQARRRLLSPAKI